MIGSWSGPGWSAGTELQHSPVDMASHTRSHTKTPTTGLNTWAWNHFPFSTNTHTQTPQGPLLTSTCLPLTAFNSGQHIHTYTHIQNTQEQHTELLTDTSSHSPPCHSAGCLTTYAWTHTYWRTAWLLVRSMVRATETPQLVKARGYFQSFFTLCSFVSCCSISLFLLLLILRHKNEP